MKKVAYFVTCLVLTGVIMFSCGKDEDSITSPESELLEEIDTLFTNWHDLYNYGDDRYTGTELDTLNFTLWRNAVMYIPRWWDDEHRKIRVMNLYRELRVSYTATTDSMSTQISFGFKYSGYFRFIHNIIVTPYKSEHIEFVCKEFQMISDVLGFRISIYRGASEDSSTLRLSNLLITGVRK